MYLSGFGNHHQTEAIPGALPPHQNSPQKCTHDLFAEQINGSAFTRPRHLNVHSWLYRRLPSVVHSDFVQYHHQLIHPILKPQAPNPMRWSALPAPSTPIDFIDGLFHLAGNKSSNAFLYHCNQSMHDRYFCNADGELLLVPYSGEITLHTEMGRLKLSAGQIAVIPRGIYFKVELHTPTAAGYICENLGLPFTLPQLGPIGANGLANPRHFLYPQAAFEPTTEAPVTLLYKFQHIMWHATRKQSPLDVVAWHGNYAPYTYDLSLFNTINTVSFDHPDPSIFTVLTSESTTPGVANIDFVIFPPRWMVAEHTFRPPYFHRNIMNELMGLIKGTYDAKQTGFEIGGVSIHQAMNAHGPDAESYQKALSQPLEPQYYQDTLAFMFEGKNPWFTTQIAMQHASRQINYTHCWQAF